MADQLCTPAQVKARIGDTDAVDDTLISELVDQVSAWIQTFTGRRFVAEDAATYVLDTRAGYSLYVPRGIRSITSMGISSSHQPETGGTYVTVTTSAMLRPKAVDLAAGWPATEIRLSRASSYRFSDAENGATVTGNFGFLATPLDVASVAIDAVVAAYTNRQDGASGVIGADATAVVPWAQFFGPGSPQLATLGRWRYHSV